MSRFRTIRSYNMGSQTDFAMAHKFGENEAAKAQGITKKIMKAGRGELSKDELDVLKSEIDDSCSILSRGRGKDAFQRALGKAEGVFEQKNGKLMLVFTAIAAFASVSALSSDGMLRAGALLAALISIVSYIVIEKFSHFGDTEKFFDWLNDKSVEFLAYAEQEDD